VIRLDRFLVVDDTLDGLATNERLASLVRARSGPMTLTVRLGDGANAAAVDSRLRGRFQTAAARGVEIRLADARPSEALLDAHDAYVPGDTPTARALIVPAWQRGLCVVNTVEQAERVAAFEDESFEPEGARRWYSIMEGDPVIVTNPQHIELAYGARVNPRAVIHNESAVSIGRGSLLGADAELNLFTARLTMGQFCHTSSYFAAVGSRHTLHYPSTFAVSRGPYAFLGEPADRVGDLVIGNDVWFGMRVILLPGVRVADGCVVGAGSVVTHSLTEPYGIYAGSPARLIRLRFAPHVVKWLCAIQWWNWPTRRLWEAREFFRTDLSNKTEDELWRLIGG
jgi:acetyltransferase-like isoleucine patch superfamily enzyme